jgi:PAS domain S-box-containing protein
LLTTIGLYWFSARSGLRQAGVFRIGWEHDPPFQMALADGEPSGLAIELVREAARRRNIRLQWIRRQRSGETSLVNRQVDLWPLITFTQERKKRIYISEAYLEHGFFFLVRQDAPYRSVQDLEQRTLSHLNQPIVTYLATEHFPRTRLIAKPNLKDVIAEVCEGRADGAFLEENSALSALLDGIPCAGIPMRLIWIPSIRTKLGVGATFEAAGVADEIREEIGKIAKEGRLSSMASRWGDFSVRDTETIHLLQEARQRERTLLVASIVFACLLLVAMWQTIRRGREAKRARRAEQTLRQMEQKLRLMANNMKEMVLAYDMDRRLIFANPAVETLTGYRFADLEEGGFVKWIHPDDHERMLAHWGGLFQGNSFENEEYRLITKGGRTRWASASWGAIRDEAGMQVGVQGSERDITERKLADEALRESERRFRGLLEHVQLAAALLDINGNYIFVNDYALAVTGWTREELMGHHVNEFLPPGKRNRIQKLLDNLARTGEPEHWFSEIPVHTKDGRRRLLQVNSVALHDSGGKVVAIASVGADVTDHRALQERYLQSQKLESLGTLAGGVAHDFNNLLTVINGYSDMVFWSLSEGDAARPKIDEIRKAGARAAELTQQLLAFSRRQIAQPQPVDLNGMVEESGAMFRSLLGERIELATRLSHPLGQVMADPGQMHRVLMNLLTNARDAMSEGGRVTIETMNVAVASGNPEEHPDVTPGPCVLLQVSDTGVGIDEEVRVHLFEPFFTTKGLGKGTGLGLSTVYGIVKQSRGSICVYSEVGKGATFKIYLPRIDTEHIASEEEPQAVAARGNQETVLVVEDQQDVRALATAILASLGYRVLSAADGPTALELEAVHEGPIDLVLTDVVLPGMNGKQLAERLQFLRPGIAVLFTSGYSQDVIAHSGVLDREVAYMPKPYSPKDLATKVREVLGE